jgi:hypothetical protein
MINKMVIGYMADQMSGAAMAMPQDPKAAFKAEWESLWKLFSINGLYEIWKKNYSALPLTVRKTKPFLIL